MKYWKSFIAGVLSLTLIMGLVSCQGGRKTSEDSDQTEVTTVAEDADATTDASVQSPGANLQEEAQKQALDELKKKLDTLYPLGQEYKDLPALRIEETEIPVHVLNFYASLASKTVSPELQSGLFDPDNQALLETTPREDSEETTREMLLRYAKKQAMLDYFCHKQAEAEKFEAKEDSSALGQQVVAQLQQFAAQQNLDAEKLMTLYYGWGNETEAILEMVKYYFEAEQYRDHYAQQIDVSAEELEAEYEANRDVFDHVEFRAMLFTNTADDFLTAEELAELEKTEEYTASEESEEGSQAQPESPDKQAEYQANAKLRAESMQKRVKTEEDFVRLQPLYTKKIIANELAKQPDSTKQSVPVRGLPPELREFLENPEREEGDTAVLESQFGTWLVYYIGRQRDTSRSYTTRHILIQAEKPEDENSWKEAEEKAKQLLADFKAGKKDEESFAELAKQHSKDPGSASQGGLYEDVNKGQFVPEYEEWALDAKRKEGDVDIVKSDHGYHIIYFVKLGDEAWEALAKRAIRTRKTKEWLDEAVDQLEVEELDGMKYVVPLD